MAGKIKMLIDTIIDQRSKGNPTIASTTKTKIILKGINPDQFGISSEDDPVVIERVISIAQELGITLK